MKTISGMCYALIAMIMFASCSNEEMSKSFENDARV